MSMVTPYKSYICYVLIAVLTSGLIAPWAIGGGSGDHPPIPDLTKPNMWRPTPPNEKDYYNLGPTGMMGLFMGPSRSDKIFVDRIELDSPAHGKMKRGDLIIGVNGVPFKKGDNLIVTMGNAIIEAEKEENKGKITFIVWRDKNWPLRTKELDVNQVSVDEILAEVKEDTDALADWKTEEQARAYQDDQEFDKAYKEFPIDATTLEITLTLEVMGAYSDTAPFNCPKTEKIIEKAYPHIENAAKSLKKGLNGWRHGTLGLALLATGKPEHQELVTELLHKNEALLEGRPVGNPWRWGMGAWYGGYYTTFLAEYYLRTGDKAILPGLRAWALGVARVQAYGGTWGHSGHDRAKNLGRPHGPATGYGAMNQAAGPCFYGLSLAQKCGLNEPEIDEAVRRSVKFYATYVDKGCVPYGYHGPWSQEDSNGKNGPPGLAMKMAGQPYMAKYYALTSAVGSSWGYRGGHADGTFGNYWPQLTSCLAGPEVVAAWMKVAHPYYTMLRRHNGAWVGTKRGNIGGIGCQFNPTAMYMIQHNIPKKTLYMTGRDPDPKIQATERDLMHLNDRITGRWKELTTDQIIERLDTPITSCRLSTSQGYPVILEKRYKNGETDILPKLIKVLDHENHRAREAAFNIIARLGRDEAKKILPRAVEGLKDPHEIVRMAAVRTIRRANSEMTFETKMVEVEGKMVEVQVEKKSKEIETIDLKPVIDPLFAAALRKFEDDTHDTFNTHHLLQQLMINSNNAFAKDPFGQGYDTEKVALVLEEFLSQDPRDNVMRGASKFWSRETTVRMAGPTVFVAENFPMNNMMGGGSAPKGAQELLLRHKFLEGLECSMMECNKISRVRRAWRPRLSPSNLGWFKPTMLQKNPGLGKAMLPYMYEILVERPNLTQMEKLSKTKKIFLRMDDAIDLIENTPKPEGWTSLRDEAMQAFWTEVDAQGSKDKQVAYCRAALLPERKTYFRQMAAMTRLVELLGEDATSDLGPYLSHDHWRFQDHSRELILNLKGAKVTDALVTMSSSDDEVVAAGALTMLGKRGDKEGVKVGLKLITSHKSGLVRGAAAQAIYGGSDGGDVDKLLKYIKDAEDALELEGYEAALLMRRSDPGKAKATAEALRKTVPGCSIQVRRSLYYVLGQLGGSANLNFLTSRVGTKDDTEFDDMVEALSWSPDVSATNHLVKILKDHQGTRRAMSVSKLSFKRVINGGERIGHVPDSANLDFATEHLKVVRSLDLLVYLGRIKDPRCVKLLFQYMKLGPEKVTAQSVKSIIQSAEGIPATAPLKDRKAVAEILAEVLQFINVVYTRADIETLNKWEGVAYIEWKIQADKAGAIIKRIYNPREEALDASTGINDDDLDL